MEQFDWSPRPDVTVLQPLIGGSGQVEEIDEKLIETQGFTDEHPAKTGRPTELATIVSLHERKVTKRRC